MSKDVGRTWRTPGKHHLMRDFIRQEHGAAGNITWIDRLIWIDLSAGDAAVPDDVDWRYNCSPGILASHAVLSVKPVRIFLYEIQPATYDRLLANLGQRLPGLGYERTADDTWRSGDHVVIRAFNLSGHRASVNAIHRRDAVVAFNDPNAITEWAMRDEFVKDVGDRTNMFRSLSTMGCNAAGLKRLDPDKRMDWFGLVEAQQASLPQSRDLCLAAIERDDAQWAYLLSTSVKWRGKTESVVRTAFKQMGRTAAISWYRQDPAQFQEAKLQLFLTKKERLRLSGHEEQWLAASQDERLEFVIPDNAPEPQDDGWTLFDFDEEAGAA